MIKSMRTTEGFTLHMQWIEQFVKEAEQALELENVRTTAQTVLFYAGMHVQIEKQQAAASQDHQLNGSHQAGSSQTETTNDWLLAPEEEVVKAALEITAESFHPLLKLSLQTVIEDEERLLTLEERTYIHSYASRYISQIKEKVNQFGTYWLH
ncbi:hypothetical protein [Paenibacillus sp. FSL H7-0331]|uniref:hypothetical protein n=1 Tax=Paenibacillus sp. FSL H7-0331 TaxID=1920421 RepID=UPI00096C212D|nr:hypothetical protein [Paenibacillus sp. FSL H7-0331]OMF16117.1 hypothetical protein BK127_14815 [Paenibacillus sp. FSL H7-0331]